MSCFMNFHSLVTQKYQGKFSSCDSFFKSAKNDYLIYLK